MISCLLQNMSKSLRSSGNILKFSKVSNCDSRNVMTCIQGIQEHQTFYGRFWRKNTANITAYIMSRKAEKFLNATQTVTETMKFLSYVYWTVYHQADLLYFRNFYHLKRKLNEFSKNNMYRNRLDRGCTFRISNPVRTCADRPQCPISLLYNKYRGSFPRG